MTIVFKVINHNAPDQDYNLHRNPVKLDFSEKTA